MKLDLTGRHVAVTPALREFAETKMNKLEKLVPGPLEVHVILTVEKHRHITEIIAHGRNMSMSAREVTDDMYTSIGECVEKIESQARRQKEKYETRRRRGKGRRADAGELPETPGEEEGNHRGTLPEVSTPRPDGLPEIVRSDVYPRKPMTVEEAALQVRESDLGFFVFRNSLSGEINVLFKRGDGSLGLIEPEA